jgi:SAM-dependent methyltransferase
VTSAGYLGLIYLSWFRNQVKGRGLVYALVQAFSVAWQFMRESMPDRRRQRYGDVDYDWDHRVDTTAATVGWRARLVGLLHSPYQPTDATLFHEMISKLEIDFSEFVFIDVGSGKGRVLLMAADYPFRRVVGIELLPELHRIALENVSKYESESQKCFAIESVCVDACKFEFPDEPLVLYLFNPLPESGLVMFLESLERSVRESPRPVFLLYHNPVLEQVAAECEWLKKLGGTHQYSVFAARTNNQGQRARIEGNISPIL